MIQLLLIGFLFGDPDSARSTPPEEMEYYDSATFSIPTMMQDTTHYKSRVEEILKRKEFQQDTADETGRNFLSEGLKWLLRQLMEALRKLFGDRPPSTVPVKLPPQDFSGFAKGLMYVLYAAGAVALVIILYRLFQFYRLRQKSNAGVAGKNPDALLDPGESLEPDEHFDIAQNEARRENYRKAIRHVLISVILFLDKENLIRYPSHLTNWEFLALIQKQETLQVIHEFLFTLNRLFDKKWYGMEHAGRDDFEDAVQLRSRCLDTLKKKMEKV